MQQQYDLFIGGQFVPPHSGEYIPVKNPANGVQLTTVAHADASDVDRAFEAAKAAFESGVWSGKSARERSRILHRAAAMIAAHAPKLAEMETLCTGRAIREMRAQTGRIAEWLEYFGSIIEGLEGQVTPFAGVYLNYVRRVPLGVIAQFTAFNHPLLLAMKKVAPALAAGNCIVLKPSELAPVAALELARLLTEAGVPPGVINVVNGFGATTGKALTDHSGFAKFDITGGDFAGRLVAAAAGQHLARVTTELGGKAPAVVFADANLTEAVSGVAFGAFIAAGQTCIAATRILVQDSVYDEFVAALVAKTQSIRLGDPMDPETQMGTVISCGQLSRVDAAVQGAIAEGAKVLCGGKRWAGMPEGSFYEPTVIGDCQPQMKCVREEIFGPVIVCLRFSTEEEAIHLANDSPYGLGAAVWTRDVKRAHRVAHKIVAGIVWINSHHKNDPSSPWGGMKESGMGRENGWECLREYTQTQSIVVSLADEPDWFATAGARYN